MAKYSKAGAPTKYRPDFHNVDFLRLAKQGKTIIQIAGEWEVDRNTIYEWGNKHKEFSNTLKKGRNLAECWYANIGQLAMLNEASVNGKKVNVNLGFYVWLTKNLFKWSDKVESVPAEEKKKRPLKKVSDEDLDEM